MLRRAGVAGAQAGSAHTQSVLAYGYCCCCCLLCNSMARGGADKALQGSR